jgi:hypothetical protein
MRVPFMLVTPPDWIVDFANSVAGSLEPLEPMPPLGCHYHHCGTAWEITLFPSQTEIVGGPQDGHRLAPRFSVDILAIASLFTKIDEITWQSRSVGADDQLGSHVSVSGLLETEKVSVRILKMAPVCFDVGRKALIHEGFMIETW